MKQKQRITIISNISVTPFVEPALNKNIGKVENLVELEVIPYQEYSAYDNIEKLKSSETVVVWLNLEEIFPQMHSEYEREFDKGNQKEELENECRNLAEYIIMQSHARVLWISFEDYFLHRSVIVGHRTDYFVEQINSNLQRYFRGKVIFIDLKYLIAECGIEYAFSAKNKFRWNFPYSKRLVEKIAVEIQKQCYIETFISKKCLVLDCDGVLWGGVLSEDGIENIQIGSVGLGREYQEFQRFVLSLYNRGVILAICTKNDLADIHYVFREHSGMILKEEHIACFMANWENKPDNIRQIAENLNISLGSMVFIDDSMLEVEAVRRILPEVTAIKYHRENMYEDFFCFNLKDDICYEDVMKRHTTYRTDQYRKELKALSSTYDEYIDALEIKIDIHEALPSELGRLAELTQRTNKCTNGVRCTLQNIKDWEKGKEICLYSVFLEDKFSDLGLVGVFGVKENELQIFSLSCRALGRHVEEKMIEYIQMRYKIRRIQFSDTGKNKALRVLLSKYFPEV